MIMKKSKKNWILLLCAVIAAGGLLIFSLTQLIGADGKLPLSGLIRADLLYIIAVFLIMIPIFLINTYNLSDPMREQFWQIWTRKEAELTTDVMKRLSDKLKRNT